MIESHVIEANDSNWEELLENQEKSIGYVQEDVYITQIITSYGQLNTEKRF